MADAELPGGAGLPPRIDGGARHVLGRYDLLLPLASGGMAMVWVARLRGTRGFQKLVAIKTMLPKLSDDEHFEQMFLDEAALASQVRHPHVVEILDLGEEDEVLFLVMEWIEGVPLHELLKTARKAGGVPLNISVRIVSQALAGLHAAHELQDASGQLVGLVHRDISPQNILVTYDGVAKVVDFGVAKATAIGDGTTAAGKIKGKAAYMAPEQIRDEHIDRRIDIFAMGIVLYAMTTGRHPFRKESEGATLYNICSPKPAAPPRKLVPGYPASLERVVLQALAKDPAKRYATANDMLRALDHALPASMRVGTDEEVAGFVRGLFKERRETQKLAIQKALEAADSRAATGVSLRRMLDSTPPPAPSGSTSDLSTAGPLSVSGPRASLANEEHSWPDRSAPELSSPGVPTDLALVTGPHSAIQNAEPPAPRRSGLRLLLGMVALLLGVLLAGAIFVRLSRNHQPVADATSADPAPDAVPATLPKASATPAVSASAAPEASVASPDAALSAEPPPAPKNWGPPKPTKPKTGGSWRHDPGF